MTRTARWAIASCTAAVVVLVIALEFGHGAPQPVPEGIPDPGALTGWGLPVATLVTEIAAVATVGFLVTAVFLLPSEGMTVAGLAVRSAHLASRSAFMWVISTIALYLFTVSDIFAIPIPRSFGWAWISSLATGSSLGRRILGQLVIALVIMVAARWTVGVKGLAAILGLSLAGLAPVSLTGHAAGSGPHELATISLLMHLIGVTLWVGGLAALFWVALRGSKRLDAAILRFSTLAAWCFGLVGLSGVVNAAVRLGSVANLFTTDYGILILGKVAALAVLGVFGYRQRRRIVAKGLGFARLAATELFIMAMTIGLAVALSRTPTPVPSHVLKNPVEELLGQSMPSAPTAMRLLWGWSPSGIGMTIVGLGMAFYLSGVITLHRRGVRWPIGRTISWSIGMIFIAWVTFGGLGVYSHLLFSAHMVSLMMLTMIAPIFLILAAPATLALRTLPGPRQPGEFAPRKMLISLLNSRFSRFLTHPLVGPVLFVGSLYGLYFTKIFDVAMRNHWGHALMVVHFLAVGTLFYYVLVGIDPSPRKLAPLVRFGLLMVTVPFHAFFAISVMSSNTIFAKSYFEWVHRSFLTDLADDQFLGGGIAWAMGEVPLVLVLGAIFVQWIKSDAREAKRFDRNEAKSGDDALESYNECLSSLHESDGAQR